VLLTRKSGKKRRWEGASGDVLREGESAGSLAVWTICLANARMGAQSGGVKSLRSLLTGWKMNQNRRMGLIALGIVLGVVGTIAAIGYAVHVSEAKSADVPTTIVLPRSRTAERTEHAKSEGKAEAAPQKEAAAGSYDKEKKIVEDYLRKTLPDPSGMEFVEWGPIREGLFSRANVNGGDQIADILAGTGDPDATRKVEQREANRKYTPAVVLGLRFRAKNGFGALQISEFLFLVQDGQIAGACHVDRDAYVPRDVEISIALAQLGQFKP
jgi:hypothetical protein